jgi:hypothetical protein
MKATKTLLLALAALSTLATSPHARGAEATSESMEQSVPSGAIEGTNSGDSAKDLKIAALETRVAELEAMNEAFNAKLAAIQKQIYPKYRSTIGKRGNRNSQK